MQPLFNLEGTRITQNYTRKDKNIHSTSHSRWVFALDLSVTQKPHNKAVSLLGDLRSFFLIAMIAYVEFYQCCQSRAPCTILIFFFLGKEGEINVCIICIQGHFKVGVNEKYFQVSKAHKE